MEHPYTRVSRIALEKKLASLNSEVDGEFYSWAVVHYQWTPKSPKYWDQWQQKREAIIDELEDLNVREDKQRKYRPVKPKT